MSLIAIGVYIASLLGGIVVGVSFFRFFRYLYAHGIRFGYALVVTILLIETARFFFLLFSSVVLKQVVRNIAPDGSFVVSFFGGMLWSSVDAAILFAMLVVLVLAFKKKAMLPLPNENPSRSILRNALIITCVGVFSVFYNESIIPRIGSFVRIPKFACDLGTKNLIKASCLNRNSSATIDSGTTDGFVEVSGSNLKVKELGGKPAFYNTKFVYFDGKVYEDNYIESFDLVDGRLVYVAVDYGIPSTDDDNRQWIVFDGKKYGTEYTYASHIADIHGKLGFIGKIAKDRKNPDSWESYVVIDGKRYGERAINNDLVSIGSDSFAYSTLYVSDEKTQWGKPKKLSTVIWNNRIIYGPSEDAVRDMYDVDGTPVYVTVDGGVYMGSNQIAKQYPKPGWQKSIQFTINGDKFAFVVLDRGKKKVYSYGKVHGKGYKEIIGPYIANDGIFFAGINDNDSTDIVFDDTILRTYSERANQFGISDDGKTFVLTMGKDGLKSGKIYIDDTLLPYSPYSSSGCKFLGSKLFCEILSDDVPANYFDGKVFAYKYIHPGSLYIDGAYVFHGRSTQGWSTFIFGNPSWLEKYKELSKEKGRSE